MTSRMTRATWVPVVRRPWILAVLVCVNCRSADLAGPGPSHPSVIGTPGNRYVENPPIANDPTNYGYGSAYDPHGTGSRAQPVSVGENGAIPLISFPFNSSVKPGLPPKVDDSPHERDAG
jgi:hypothetical protein